jgi:hypothetical protein
MRTLDKAGDLSFSKILRAAVNEVKEFRLYHLLYSLIPLRELQVLHMA